MSSIFSVEGVVMTSWNSVFRVRVIIPYSSEIRLVVLLLYPTKIHGCVLGKAEKDEHSFGLCKPQKRVCAKKKKVMAGLGRPPSLQLVATFHININTGNSS
jgi:hypothetical protein